jgi:molybdate transport system regulatory protein
MKIRACNPLKGTVSKVTKGPVNSEAALALKDGEKIATIITNENGDSLGPKAGDQASASFKASGVILAVD